MIIEIPDDNSIVKWRYKDNEDWKSAEISDLIKAYETDIETQLLGAELHGIKIGYEEAQAKYQRPQGEWERVRVDKTHYNYVCSECGYKAEFRKGNFCPNCGAQMIKEVKKNDN